MPEDSTSVPPMTQLASEAALHHELFTAYIAAGFTENQAIRLIIGLATAGRSDQ